GGYNGTAFLNSVEAYNPATNTWSPSVSMPSIHYFAGSEVVNGTAYLIGGQSASGTLSNQTDAFTPTHPLVITQATPAVDLTSSANPSNFNQQVTFTATVSGPTNPTGNLTFKD